MENIRKVTKGHKGCKQESLIRMLNAKIRGWGAYYQHGATRDSFHRIDHQIFLALWQWLNAVIPERETVDKRPLLAQYPREQLDFCG